MRVCSIIGRLSLILVIFAVAAPAFGQTPSSPVVQRADPPDLLFSDSVEYSQVQHFIVYGIAALLVMGCVLFHNAVLMLLGKSLQKVRVITRMRIVTLIYGIILAHLTEIFFFAIGYYLLCASGKYGHIVGSQELNYTYFSFVVFTTLGFGDFVPVGPVRFLTAVEALTGLVLITWSASYTFLQMQRYWGDQKET
jgi:hypothetical protein